MRGYVFQIAILLVVLFAARTVVQAQWAIQNSNTTADLRGIHSVDGKVVWASGTNGTVLRTVDGGANWQVCSTPPGAEKLDFRGVQAFDAKTAIVMSSGKGDLSRLYQTTDGCATWKLVFTNPDEDGFWDAIYETEGKQVYVLGDPVRGVFAMFQSEDAGRTWYAAGETGRESAPGEGAFAASNSSLTGYGVFLLFGTGGISPSHVYGTGVKCSPPPGHPTGPATTDCTVVWSSANVPVGSGGAPSGVFSLAAKPFTSRNAIQTAIVVAVGGRYDRPDEPGGTAAYSSDGGRTWPAAQTTPHGYRSAVAYDAETKTWITVGPNGTDVSTDDGRNWSALKPDVARGEVTDADRNWNALSLPFVVGPKGRIGRWSQGSGLRAQEANETVMK